MLLAISIAASLTQSAIPSPAEFAGEASLGEIVQYIEKKGSVIVHVSDALAKRPLYFYWADQPVEELLKGSAFALDLKLAKAEKPAEWSLRLEDRDKARREEFIREIEAQMAFRFRLLNSSPTEVAAMDKAARDRWLGSGKTEITAYRESSAISRFENERPLIRIMARLGRIDHMAHFFGKESPSNCIVLDPSQHPEIAEIVPHDTLPPDTKLEGEPIFLLVPWRSTGRFEYQLIKCYANAPIRLASISFFGGESFETGFEADKNPIFQKPIKLELPFEIRVGHSLEILPPAFKQLDSSFAAWCPTSFQGMFWSRLPDKFPLSFLVERWPIPRRRDSTEPQKYRQSFLHQEGWTKVLYDELPKSEPSTDWTKLLPFLRKLRKHEVSVIELADYVSDLSSKELAGVANAMAERGDMPVSDIEFLQAIYLIRSISNRKSDLEPLSLKNRTVEIPFSKISRAGREALTDYFGTSRFWPLHAWMQHPGFPDRLKETTVLLEIKEVDGKSELNISIKGLEHTGTYHNIPIATIN